MTLESKGVHKCICDECGKEKVGSTKPDWIRLSKTKQDGMRDSLKEYVDFCSFDCLKYRLEKSKSQDHFRLWETEAVTNDD